MRRKIFTIRRTLIVVLMMLSIAAGVVAFVSSGKNGTLVRNSLVAQAMEEDGLRWMPGAEPGDYKLESKMAPLWVAKKWEAIAAGGSGLILIESAIEALHRQRSVSKAIQDDLRTTWSLIESRGLGYCADYSKVFNAMMLAAGVPVREWGLGHRDFGSGHTFNEIYLDGQWVFVDAFNGMLVRDRESDRLLSVLEFRQRLVDDDRAGLEVVKLTDPELFFQTSEEGLNYYARSTDYFYLIWGNNVFSYDSSPWVQRAAAVARPLERLVAIISGDFPRIRLLETESNSGAISQVMRLRWTLYAAMMAELLLGLYLCQLLSRMALARRNAPTR